MPRKEKIERAKPSAAEDAQSPNRFGQWRRAVEELLISKWQRSADVKAVAATVVGMFEAGASDAEVAWLLRSHEVDDEDEALFTAESRLALVQELRESEAPPSSRRPSNE
jgi:hypothetical protein